MDSGNICDLCANQLDKTRDLSVATRVNDAPLGFCKGDRPWLGAHARERCGGDSGHSHPRPPLPEAVERAEVDHLSPHYTGGGGSRLAGRPRRCLPEPRLVAVSDQGTFGGLTQFLTQLGFSGSSIRPQTIDSKDTERCPSG